MKRDRSLALAANDDTLHGQGGSDGSHIAGGSLPRQTALESAATSTETMRTASCDTIPRSATRSDEFRPILEKSLTTLSTRYTLTSSNYFLLQTNFIASESALQTAGRFSFFRWAAGQDRDTRHAPRGLGFVVSWEGNLWSLAAEDDTLHRHGGSDGSHIAAGSLPGAPRLCWPRHRPRPCALPAVAQFRAPPPDQTSFGESGKKA